MWFIPIRIGGNKGRVVIQAESLEHAVNFIKALPDYWQNANKLTFKQQKLLDIFQLEGEFCRVHKLKQERFEEEIINCTYRDESDIECICKDINKKEVPDNRCIIHNLKYRFELPKDCPYLSKESQYVNFIS